VTFASPSVRSIPENKVGRRGSLTLARILMGSPLRIFSEGCDVGLGPVSTVRGRAAIGPESGVNRTNRTPRNQRVCPSHWQLSRHSCLWAAVDTSRLRSDRVLSERGN
jgi:hypothetical protein